jgi:hypothetical protein
MPLIYYAIVGVLPLFMGFVVIATIIFIDSYNYKDICYAAMTLFSTMNGDE